ERMSLAEIGCAVRRRQPQHAPILCQLPVIERLTSAHPVDRSSHVMSRWRRAAWRLSVGGGLWLRRRSLPSRRSRITSLLLSANTCSRYLYRYAVLDTMRRNSATTTSARLRPRSCTLTRTPRNNRMIRGQGGETPNRRVGIPD